MDLSRGPCIPYFGLPSKGVADPPPHETDNELKLSEMEKFFSSILFHRSVNFDHLRGWPNIQHLLELFLSKIRKDWGVSPSWSLRNYSHEGIHSKIGVCSKINQK
ncbi:hypothetical protein NPIL_599151 [Nephila pilipes]|uniref:Uncharacterized protein n=1 Tax=Nephila pilipes TaxID=299642 RepID=A0A8X6NDN4_NEPPI|nr:hypothetical protein NPIL_599151 [Nephila pilipes]